MSTPMLQEICIEYLLSHKENLSEIIHKLPHQIQVLLIPRITKEIENENRKLQKENTYLTKRNTELEENNDRMHRGNYYVNMLKTHTQNQNLCELVEFLDEVNTLNIYNRDDDFSQIRRQYRNLGKKIRVLRELTDIKYIKD